MRRSAALVLPLLWSAACAGPEPEGAPLSERLVSEDVAPVALAPASPDGESLDPPAGPGSFAPSLTAAPGALLLTWLEPGEAAGTHRVRFSRLAGGSWVPPVTVAEGDDFFANWADFPRAARAGDGSLVVHWLAKTAADTYAYSIFLARSTDGGETWEPLGKLNDDSTPTEHGFVSFVPEGEGLRAFWLDGRAMAAPEPGPMSLRTAYLGPRPGAAEVLDERVCECCSTGAVRTAAGPVVVYRDRSDEEIRDIFAVGRHGEDWTAPVPIHADGWKIPGCPVNGPEIAAAGERVAVAWFTGADERPEVRLAFSDDAAASFGEPVLVDGDRPMGRVDVVLDGSGGAIVTWLGSDAGGGRVLLRRVSADGALGEPLVVAETEASRASGFPRMARVGKDVYLAWVEVEEGEESRVRVRRMTRPPARSQVASR